MYSAPRLAEHRRHRGQVAAVGAGDLNLPSGCGSRRQIGGGHNAVAHDGVLRPVEGQPAPDGDHGAAGAPHVRAHGAQEGLEIHNLRLPGGVGDGGDPLGRYRRQHGVLRGPHAGDGEHNVGPRHVVSGAAQGAAGLVHRAAEGPDGGQMQVDGPGAQLTASGRGEHRLPHPAQDGPQENDGRAHLPHQVVGHVAPGQAGGVHPYRVPLPGCFAAQMLQNGQGGGHVRQFGAVANDALPPAQDRGRQNGQHAVLGAVGTHCPLQPPAALHQKNTHILRPPQSWSCFHSGHTMRGFTGAFTGQTVQRTAEQGKNGLFSLIFPSAGPPGSGRCARWRRGWPSPAGPWPCSPAFRDGSADRRWY